MTREELKNIIEVMSYNGYSMHELNNCVDSLCDQHEAKIFQLKQECQKKISEVNLEMDTKDKKIADLLEAHKEFVDKIYRLEGLVKWLRN